MIESDIESVRITRCVTHYDGKEYHSDARPFSDVFIVAAGRTYYSRLFHTLDDSLHARAAQAQAFLKRQNADAPE
jgi:DNA-directed RNA polymerase beta subunit